jgi:cystathionine beta-lyase
VIYNFDEIIDRSPKSNTFSFKWQGYEGRFPGFNINTGNVISMWVADMDFRAPQEVISALSKRVEHGIYGYSAEDANDVFRKAAVGWFARRYNWKCQTEWMLFTPGVVPAINNAIQEFTKEGDGVIIQPPVYYPFAAGIVNNHRTIINNQLKEVDGRYEIDFENLEMHARNPQNKMIILCNPHNPVGRVWTRNEMYRVCKICYDNNVLIFGDEIHADLIMSGHKLLPIGSLKEFHDKMILAHAPSKTFNLAGLCASLVTIPSPELRTRMATRLFANRMPGGNTFGPIAGAAAYEHGDEYADAVVAYIEANVDYAIAYLNKNLPAVKIIKPEGTYLIWFDFRATGLAEEEIYRTVIEKAKVVGDLGKWFGLGGSGFMRFNFACPRAILQKALERITKVLK